MKPHSRFLAVALFAIVGIGSAVAQEGQQQQTPATGNEAQSMMSNQGWGMMGGPGHTGMMAPGWQGMMGPAMMGDYGPMMEGRLAYMKAELGITEAQRAVWDGYANAVKARTMQAMHTSMVKVMKGSAIERLDARIDAMTSMVESLKAERPAIDALYKTLSDDQKKKADLLIGVGCCMM
jgi:uncharacterized small protein (DUF1192 family)